MSKEQKQYQPQSVMWRNAEWIHNLSQKLGVSDFDMNFDNNFQMYRLILRICKEVKEALNQEVIKTPEGYQYPDKEVNEMDAMWNGSCYYGIKRENGYQRKIFFTKPDESKFDEVIRLPKLKNLIPVGELSDETLLIQIREQYPVKWALEGISYTTLITDGNFIRNFSDGSVPKITEEQMKSTSIQIYYLSRSVYSSLMDDYDMFFFENQTKVSINFQKLIDFAEIGGDEAEYEEEATTNFFS